MDQSHSEYFEKLRTPEGTLSIKNAFNGCGFSISS